MIIEEIAPGLFALSHLVAVSNRSWIPAGSYGFEPFNVYLALTDERALLIDTGPPAHREAIVSAVESIVGSRDFSLMVTRSELECIGNIGAIIDRLPVKHVLGTMKNLPILGLVHFEKPESAMTPADRVVVGRTLEPFGFARLRPLEPVIKTLSTIWMEDEAQGILFTSDFFSADLMAHEFEDLVRRDAQGAPSREYIRRRVLAKFDWLARADLTALKTAWIRFFEGRGPSLIAPGLGRIQAGRSLTAKTIEDYRVAIFGLTGLAERPENTTVQS